MIKKSQRSFLLVLSLAVSFFLVNPVFAMETTMNTEAELSSGSGACASPAGSLVALRAPLDPSEIHLLGGVVYENKIEKQRKIVALNVKGDSFLFYQSTGDNSKSAGTWFPMVNVTWNPGKNCLYLDKRYPISNQEEDEIGEVFRGLTKGDFYDYRRFGNRQLLEISAAIGGGFWATAEGARIIGEHGIVVGSLTFPDYPIFSSLSDLRVSLRRLQSIEESGTSEKSWITFAVFGTEILLSLANTVVATSKRDLTGKGYKDLLKRVEGNLAAEKARLLTLADISLGDTKFQDFIELVWDLITPKLNPNFLKLDPSYYISEGYPGDKPDLAHLQRVKGLLARLGEPDKDKLRSDVADVCGAIDAYLGKPSSYVETT